MTGDDPADALSRARRLVDEAWADPDVWTARYAEARSLLCDAVAEHPDDTSLLTAYGTVLCDLREYDAAVPVLERAIDLGSDDANTFFALAVAAFNVPVPYRTPGTFRRPRTLFKKASRLQASPLTWPAYFDFQAH